MDPNDTRGRLLAAIRSPEARATGLPLDVLDRILSNVWRVKIVQVEHFAGTYTWYVQWEEFNHVNPCRMVLAVGPSLMDYGATTVVYAYYL